MLVRKVSFGGFLPFAVGIGTPRVGHISFLAAQSYLSTSLKKGQEDDEQESGKAREDPTALLSCHDIQAMFACSPKWLLYKPLHLIQESSSYPFLGLMT